MKKVFSDVLVSLIAVIIAVIIILLFQKIGLPQWPFVILLVVMADVYHLSIDQFIWLFVSGLIGILVGFSAQLFGAIMPGTIALILFLVVIVVWVAFDVAKVFKIANAMGTVFANIIINVPGVADMSNVVPVSEAYVLSAAIVGIICYLLKLAADKKAKDNTKQLK